MRILLEFTNRKKITRDISIMSLLIVIPFLFYLHNLIPIHGQELKVLWFVIDSGNFESIHNFLWILSVKIITLLILSIWFLTCSHKWRLVLFFPIAIEIYKIYVNISFASKIDNYKIIIINTILTFIVYFLILFQISKKLDFINNNKDVIDLLNFEINEKLNEFSKFNRKDFMKIKKELRLLKRNKNLIDKKEYLINLIALRDRLTII